MSFFQKGLSPKFSFIIHSLTNISLFIPLSFFLYSVQNHGFSLFFFLVYSFPSDSLYGFEFGNELYGRVDPSLLAQDYIKLKSLLVKYWPDESKRPKLIGPDYASGHIAEPGITTFLQASGEQRANDKHAFVFLFFHFSVVP